MTHYDVVVIGAGAAGGPLAARLSEDADRSVLLVEAGPDAATMDEFPKDLLDAGLMTGVMPTHPNNWNFVANLTPTLPYTVARGKVLGGSSALNGTYFIRATKHDHDRWAAEGFNEWSYEACLPFWKQIETDATYGPSDVHGTEGPVNIYRPQGDEIEPITQAFFAASKELGFVEEADKNDGRGEPGYGLLPMNQRDGIRLNTGISYVMPARSRENLTVRGNTLARKVILEGTKVVGVEVETNGKVETIATSQVVLSAGAIKSPHLLALSGIGPKAELEAAGIKVIVDLPGVGKNFTDHPDISIAAIPTKKGSAATRRDTFQAVLNFTAKDSKYVGDLEILLMIKTMKDMLNIDMGGPKQMLGMILHPIKTIKSFQGVSIKRLMMQAAALQQLGFPVAVQLAESRGAITTVSADPSVQPKIDYNYLSNEDDLRRMREVVRVAVQLFGSSHFKPFIKKIVDLDDPKLLNDDAALDAWMLSHLGTAIHAASSARMGTDPKQGAVVDQYGRVHGVEGLRVADTSILPWVPSRGPAATAHLIGERVAHFIRTGAGSAPAAKRAPKKDAAA